MSIINNKYNRILCLLLLIVIAVAGCGKKDKDNRRSVSVTYINEAHTSLVTKSLKVDADNLTDTINEIIDSWQKPRKKLVSPLLLESRIIGCYLEDNHIIVNMDDKYRQMSDTDEILVRAAIVRTLGSLEGVEYVAILVSGEPLTDMYGNPIGVMTPDSFVDNEGSQINSNEETSLRLYFADSEGNRLIPVRKPVTYNSSKPLERVIVDEVIAGPNNSASMSTINPDTKVLSVVVTDGVCYVNLSSEFLSQTNAVTAEVTIYSIVNSLSELSNVNKVQFLVEGNSNANYQEAYDLSKLYERNLDIVKEN